MKINIPGSLEGQYMATDANYVDVKDFSVKGEYAFEARGLWYMEKDMMGGPFVSHARVDRANGRVVVVEAFVYAPERNKRELMRQMEAALYTLNFTIGKTKCDESLNGEKWDKCHDVRELR